MRGRERQREGECECDSLFCLRMKKGVLLFMTQKNVAGHYKGSLLLLFWIFVFGNSFVFAGAIKDRITFCVMLLCPFLPSFVCNSTVSVKCLSNEQKKISCSFFAQGREDLFGVSFSYLIRVNGMKSKVY